MGNLNPSSNIAKPAGVPWTLEEIRSHQDQVVKKLEATAEKYKSQRPNPNIGQGLLTPSHLPQFGEVGWVNPNFDPYHNANGYHRFDPQIPGMGMQTARTYADGASAYDSYQQNNPGTGYAIESRKFLQENGIDAATATDMQKYAAMDYAGRLGQWKNQRPKRKFGVKDAFGLALSVAAIFSGNPYLAAGLAAGGSAVKGGDLGDILTAGALAGVGNFVGGKIADKIGGAATAGNSVDKMLAAAANSGSGVGTAVKNASTLATLGKAAVSAAPYVGSAIVTADAINQSGVNLTPDQNSILKGGAPKITTFEPENKNIALSAHPTSAYAAAYPNVARPINTAPIAPINRTTNQARPYVAPPRAQIAPNMPIIGYDPSRNYSQTPTMQQALMRPAATRGPSKNARTTQ